MSYPIDVAIKPEVTPFFDRKTNTISYVVKDPSSPSCAVIDSVMDIDYAAGRISCKCADLIIDYFRRNGLRVDWPIETHAHADHLSAAPYIQQKLGGKVGIGEHIVTVQETFGKIFNEGTEFQRDGSQLRGAAHATLMRRIADYGVEPSIGLSIVRNTQTVCSPET